MGRKLLSVFPFNNGLSVSSESSRGEGKQNLLMPGGQYRACGRKEGEDGVSILGRRRPQMEEGEEEDASICSLLLSSSSSPLLLVQAIIIP